MALRLRGATSGYIELKAPASAGDNTLTLPTNNGGANQLLKIDGSGNLSWQANLTFDGTKLGIGTASPETILHLHDSTNTRIQITDNGTGAASGDGVLVGLNGDDDFFINNRESGKGLKFFTGSDDLRLHITSTGKLEVKGTRAGSLQASDDDTLQLYTASTNNSIDRGSGITFYNHDNSGYEMGGTIQVAKENGDVDNVAAYMRFSTRPAGGSATERLRIDSTGKIDLNAAAAKIGNSAGGTSSTYIFAKDLRFVNEDITATNAIIDTNGLHLDTTSPTAANGLNDYEEGVHTQAPVNANLTLTNNILRYTKIGRLVTVSGILKPSAVSGSNTVLITLPFTSVADSGTTCGRYTSALMHKFVNIDDSYKNVVGYVGQNEAYWRIYNIGDNLDWHQLTNNDLSTDTEIFFTFTYHTTE